MKLLDLTNIRKLKILQELLNLEKYKEITSTYSYLLEPNEFSDSGINIVNDVKSLKEAFQKRNYGQCDEIINVIISFLNSRIFKVKCEKKWSDLIDIEEKGVRFCNECSRHVYEVQNEIEFEKRKHLQQCVFFNPKITPETTDKICIVNVDFEDDDIGMPF